MTGLQNNDPKLNEPTLIELLQKNNEYLEKLLALKQREHRNAVIFGIFNVFIMALPWIITLILGFLMWQNINHYFEALNENLNVLKTNYDTLHGVIQKMTPDFSSVMPKIKETWQELPFGK